MLMCVQSKIKTFGGSANTTAEKLEMTAAEALSAALSQTDPDGSEVVII